MRPFGALVPVHRRSANGPSDLPLHTQRASFHEPTTAQFLWKCWDRFRKALLDLPSEPSDPLRESENGATTASDVATNYQAREKLALHEDREEDFVDEIIVNSENFLPLHTGMEDKERDRDKDMNKDKEHSVTGLETFQWASSYDYREYSLWRHPLKFPWALARIVRRFFNLSFVEEDRENEYRKERWYTMKPPARLAAAFLILNWALTLGFSNYQHLYEWILYYGGLSVLTITTFFMIIFDMPCSSSVSLRVIFQVWFTVTTWYSGVVAIIDAYCCGFFESEVFNTCGGNDFRGLIFYLTGLPCLALFTISERVYNATAQLCVFILLLALVVPNAEPFVQFTVLFVLFSVFIQWLHYNKEQAKRRVFKLQYRVRHLYRELDKAQHLLKKEAKEKEQFSAYIFHEVRVPLNTATLALQNLHLKGCFDANDPDTNIDVHALEGSLKITGQILNDVLDLQRMVSQRFHIEPRPFPLHRTIDSALRFLDVETSRKDIHLDVRLDDMIDKVPPNPHDRQHHGLWVYGDDLRLRQLLGNLLSNAVKFTPEKGSIRVSTKLLWPVCDSGSEPEDTPLIRRAKATEEKVVVWRLEVQDSGPGIRPPDLRGTPLFQPFVQTSVGKNSGTGSGLGLAIIKSIVRVSGGRLGIKSARDEGATFWVELLYPLPTPGEIAENHHLNYNSNMFLGRDDPTNSILEMPPSPLSSNASPVGSLRDNSPFSSPKPGMVRNVTSTTDSTTDNLITTVISGSPTKEGNMDLEPPLSVLVVDDDRLTRQMMPRTLSKKDGCLVDTACDGEEALAMILGSEPDGKLARNYDLIFMDNLMPRLSGEACVRKLRNLGRDDLYIVGCTGNALREDTAKYLQAGVDDVVTKPVNPAALGEYVKRAKEIRRIKRSGQRNQDHAMQEPRR